MHNATALDNAIGADHLGDRHDGGHLHNGNTGFFEFGGDRSTAACGRPSRRGEDDGINPLGLKFLSDFASKATAVGQWIDQS